MTVAPVPEGGVVALGEDGEPNGLLEEQAQTLARALLHPRAVADMVQNLGAASDVYLSEGDHQLPGGRGRRHPRHRASRWSWRPTSRPDEPAGSRVRVTLMPAVETLHSSATIITTTTNPFALDLGLHTGFGDEWLKFGPVKIFADGSLIGRTAAMFEDFDGEPGNNGATSRWRRPSSTT